MPQQFEMLLRFDRMPTLKNFSFRPLAGDQEFNAPSPFAWFSAIAGCFSLMRIQEAKWSGFI